MKRKVKYVKEKDFVSKCCTCEICHECRNAFNGSCMGMDADLAEECEHFEDTDVGYVAMCDRLAENNCDGWIWDGGPEDTVGRPVKIIRRSK